MEKLMLHQVGQRTELWHETAKEADAVHLPQCARHIALVRQNRLESLAILLAVAKANVHEAEVVLHQLE